MAAAEKIKHLIKSFAENDEQRFYSIAMQIAASEARKGHTKVAEELKKLVEEAKSERSSSAVTNILQHPVSRELNEIQDLIELVSHTYHLSDMVLEPSVQETLERIIKEQRKFNELRQYNLMPRRKLLLTGPPGCGKTMTAEALASELAIPLFSIRLDGLISRYMGETISKLKQIFTFMNTKRGVYLFDEFDSIGSHRSYGNDVGEIKRVLNSFLMFIEKDRSNSLIIAATNMQESLDKALFRRFDDIIEYPLPGKEEIVTLLQKNLKRHKEITKSEINKLAETALGLSFADITRACDDAFKEMIISDDSKISIELLEKFIERRKNLN
ncbi:MAG: ATP-binding protein [Balneolaceae bacterium]|nr:ATP-binding protein [Balneolaceae bacterium]